MTRSSNVDFVSSIIAESAPVGLGGVVRPTARVDRRSARRRARSSPSASARRFAGSIVIDARAAALARAFEREHRGDRRLADAAAAAADRRTCVRDELDDRCDAHGPASITTPRSRGRARRRARRPAARPMSGVNRNGNSMLRERQPLAEPVDLLVLHRVPLGAERRPRARGRRASRSDTKRPHALGVAQHVVDGRGHAVGKRLEALVHDRPGRARRRRGPRSRTRSRSPRSPASPRAASRASPGSARDRRAAPRRRTPAC